MASNAPRKSGKDEDWIDRIPELTAGQLIKILSRQPLHRLTKAGGVVATIVIFVFWLGAGVVTYLAKHNLLPPIDENATKHSQQWDNVYKCVADIYQQMKSKNFMPDVIVAELAPDLILGQLLINEADAEKNEKTRTYVLYDMPPNSTDRRYDSYGTGFEAGSNKFQYWIPDAIKTEKPNSKILIFDAFTKTGATLRDIKKALNEQLMFLNVKTAAMGVSKAIVDSGQRPDFICTQSGELQFAQEIPWPLRGSLIDARVSKYLAGSIR
jgi:hypothetical protein